MPEPNEQFDRRYPESAATERRTSERRRSSRLYWLIGLLFVAFVVSVVVPPLHVPMWVRFIQIALIAALCLVDRRGLTLKHLAMLCALGAAGSVVLLIPAWHTPQATLYGVLTAVLAIGSLALFNVKQDPRIR